MNNNTNKLEDSGFTIIELMITIALFGMLMTIIFSIFNIKMNTFSKMDKKIEIQQQAQFILNFMEEKVIESMGIIYLEDINGYIKHDTCDKVNLKKIIFRNNKTRDEKGYIFNISKDLELSCYNLKYGIGLSGTGTIEVGNYIESIEIEPMPSNKIYTDADGIVIKINFIVDTERAEVEGCFCYRNLSRRYLD